jgi:molybdopterin-guanine dinucleotide biosynthesis protein A
MRKIDAWTARFGVAAAEFSTAPFDPFFNVNRPDDLAEAAGLLAKLGEGG